MKMLIRYEMKKLLQRKSAGIACLLMVLGIFAITQVTVSDQFWYSQDGETLWGLSAIRAEREDTHALRGELTVERLKSELAHYHEVNGDPANYNPDTGALLHEVFLKEIMPSRKLLTLMAAVYTPTEFLYDLGILDEVTPEMIDNFYETRDARVMANLDDTACSQAEKDAVLEWNRKVAVPFTFDYTKGGYVLLARCFATCFVMIALAVCVVVSPVFAYEYQTGADAVVLSSRRGRRETVWAKLAAGFLATTGIYILGVCALLLCVLVPFGAGGWDCPLQILTENAFFSLNIGQTVMLGILLNYLVMLSLTAFIALLSAACRSPFAAVIMSMLCTAAPMFIPTTVSDLLNHIFALLPAKAMDTYTVFTTYLFYPVSGVVLALPWAVLISAAAVVALTLPLAHRRFCGHQIV